MPAPSSRSLRFAFPDRPVRSSAIGLCPLDSPGQRNASSGASAEDSWHRLGGGFRIDWTPSASDGVTLQGDIFGGRENELNSAHEDIDGRDLVLRWQRDTGNGQQFQAQAFYDRMGREDRPNGGSFHVSTYDIDLQHSFNVGSRNQFVWGGGARVAHYLINGTPSLYFDPDSRNLFLANLCVQDTFALSKAVSLTAGLKAEHDSYVGVSLLPSVRLAVKASPPPCCGRRYRTRCGRRPRSTRMCRSAWARSLP